MIDWFNKELSTYKAITPDIFDKITLKRVWSGELMKIGDTVLYAFCFDKKDDQLKLFSILDSEIPLIENQFDLVGYRNNIIPVLKFKDDTKKREYKDTI